MSRLVHLADYPYARTGSFVPAVADVLRAVAGRGWGAELVVTRGPGEEPPWVAPIRADGVTVRFVKETGYRERARWIGALLDEQPEEDTILHTHFTSFDVAAAVAAAKRPRTKVIWHEHTALNSIPQVVARNVLKFGLVGRGVEMILCPAPDLAREVRRRLGPRSRVVFLPNAIDVSQFGPVDPATRAAARAELGLPDDTAVILAFAWHWEIKGGDVFVDALRAVREAGSEVTGLVVTEESRAKAQCEDPGLDGHLRQLAPRQDVGHLYAASDLFVAPSRAEGGTPYAVLEAIASGLPVVASQIPGHTFVCDGLASALTVPPTAAATAAAIEDMLATPPTQAQLDTARARIAADFDLSIWSARLIDIYLGLFE